MGVHPEPPAPSAGAERLRAEGYALVLDVEPVDDDRDAWQDHLRNTAVTRMCSELRVAYVAARLAPDWPLHVRRSGLTEVVRELHVRYDREGWMHERFVGGTRVAQRRGKATVLEQALVEATTGDSLAAAWVVQLLVGPDGRVLDWPEWYWDLVARAEGAPVPVAPADAPRLPWGAPPV